MTTLISVLHNGHKLGKAFNTQGGLPATVIYCIECAGDFHGCYCETVPDCPNCEAIPLEV